MLRGLLIFAFVLIGGFNFLGHKVPFNSNFLPQKSATSEVSIGEVEGTVVYVYDGDTMIVKTKAGEKISVRFYGIDAPEKAQDYGLESKEVLRSFVQNQDVTLDIKDTDKYGRRVAVVYLADKDINSLMIKLGAAWHFKDFDKSSKFDYYEKLEQEARAKRKGLWKSNNPVPPWRYRKLVK